ncbi:MAG: hypothetical protein IJ370_07365, partial [Oscillospiraceae bacterium]|nr:hypothetical protein [Oscillospiraceae bacterium]
SALDDEKAKQADLIEQMKEQNKEAGKLAAAIDKVKSGTATSQEVIDLGSLSTAEAKLEEMTKAAQRTNAEYVKSCDAHKKIKSEISKQNYELDKQNNKTAKIGDKILLNSKKQNKFTQAFQKSQKSADRFGKRLKSLIASALFFSVVTKAFTALRNEFGKLITETGTKTAALVSQLKNNLTVLGRTIYESVKPHIEWILEKLVHITQLLTIAIAKALGKNVEEMQALAKATEDAGKNADKATAGFDTLQKLNFSSTSTYANTSSNGDDGSSDDDLRKTKEWLEEILPLVVAIGAGFATWKITNLLKEADLLSGKLSISITLIAVGATLLAGAAIDWKEGLHDGENTLNSVLGTIGTIALVIGLIIAGVVAWPVLLIGGLIILGMWYDNFKNDVDSWIASLPNGIYELVDIIVIASYGVWDFLKNLFKGLYEIFTGDWEKGLKRIGIAFVNLFVDILNIIIQLVNFIISALTAPFKAGWNLGQEIISWIAGDDYKKISTPEWLEWRIPKCPRIPQLATGMILPGGSPMLAWVNDQPKGQPYLEGSVENIAAAFDKYLGGRSFGNQNVNLIAKGPLAPLIRLLAFEIQNENERVSVF